MINRIFLVMVGIIAFSFCFFIGMNCGPSYEEVNRYMQSDVYKAQKAAYEKRNNF